MAKDILNLSDITLCIADCVTPSLALRAVRESQKNCNFHRSLLFTDLPLETADDCEVVLINRLNSIEDYSNFILKELAQFVQTDFALVIQWDGYVLDPSAWQDCFRKYDYIGAKWPWQPSGRNVGNGGFSLRSMRLLEATASPGFPFTPGSPEDDQIALIHRDYLTQSHSINFAGEEIADAFSYERSLPPFPTFGFHGLFNLWRHCDDKDLLNVIDQCNPRSFRSREYVELLIQFFVFRKFGPLKHLYRRLISVSSDEGFMQTIQMVTNDQMFAQHLSEYCKTLIDRE